MQHVNFSEKPEPVVFQEFKDSTYVIITTNITEITTEGTSEEEPTRTHWEGDQESFWEVTELLNKEDILENPESFINYVPSKYRQQAKDKAQEHLDFIRKNTHRVDVPSYKEGYAVMHRAEDNIYLLAGMMMGGLPYYEFADGQVVSPLTTEDISKIYTDIATHEITLQQGKQYCWSMIDAAQSIEEVDAILNQYINH